MKNDSFWKLEVFLKGAVCENDSNTSSTQIMNYVIKMMGEPVLRPKIIVLLDKTARGLDQPLQKNFSKKC